MTQGPDRPPHPLYGGPPTPDSPDDKPKRPERPAIVPIRTQRPTFTFWLIGINVAIFLAGMINPTLNNWLFVNGSAYPPAILGDLALHRLFTAMFLHANLMHILFNMYALFIIGANVERALGSTRFLLIYLLGGLGGSVLSVALGDYAVPSVGASGAVFAVWAAEMVHVYRHRQLYGGLGQRILINSAVFLAFNLFLGFSIPNIDNWGHIGGFIGGAALTFLIGPRYLLKPGMDPASMQPRLRVSDINPISQRTWMLATVYSIGLLGILILAMFLVRP